MLVSRMILLFALIFGAQAFADVHGILKVVKGDVQIKSGKTGETSKARLGQEVYPKDTIITGPDSRAKVVMIDNNELNISPDTHLEIQSYEYNPAENKKDVLLNVIYGKVRSKVEQKYDGDSAKFQVKTPSAVAGVRGTDFITGYSPATKSTSVVTFRGAVEFGTPGANGKISNAVSVTAGKQASSTAGAPPSPPVQVPKAQLNQMEQETKAEAPSSGKQDARTPSNNSGGGKQQNSGDNGNGASNGPKGGDNGGGANNAAGGGAAQGGSTANNGNSNGGDNGGRAPAAAGNGPAGAGGGPNGGGANGPNGGSGGMAGAGGPPASGGGAGPTGMAGGPPAGAAGGGGPGPGGMAGGPPAGGMGPGPGGMAGGPPAGGAVGGFGPPGGPGGPGGGFAPPSAAGSMVQTGDFAGSTGGNVISNLPQPPAAALPNVAPPPLAAAPPPKPAVDPTVFQGIIKSNTTLTININTH